MCDFGNGMNGLRYFLLTALRLFAGAVMAAVLAFPAYAKVWRAQSDPCARNAVAEPLPTLAPEEGVVPADLTPPFPAPETIAIERPVGDGTGVVEGAFLPLEGDIKDGAVILPDGRRVPVSKALCLPRPSVKRDAAE